MKMQPFLQTTLWYWFAMGSAIAFWAWQSPLLTLYHIRNENATIFTNCTMLLLFALQSYGVVV